jgi:hypothetical protein
VIAALTYFVIEKPFLEMRGSYRKEVAPPPLRLAA